MNSKLLNLLDTCSGEKICNKKKLLHDLGFSTLNEKDFKELLKMTSQIIKQYTYISNKLKHTKGKTVFYVDDSRKIKITEQMLNDLMMSMLKTIEDAKASAYCVKGYKPKTIKGYRKGGFNKPVFIKDDIKLFFYDNLSNLYSVDQTVGKYKIHVPSPLHCIYVNDTDKFEKYFESRSPGEDILYSELYEDGIIDLLFKDFFKYNISCVGILYNLFLLYVRKNNLFKKVNGKSMIEIDEKMRNSFFDVFVKIDDESCRIKNEQRQLFGVSVDDQRNRVKNIQNVYHGQSIVSNDHGKDTLVPEQYDTVVYSNVVYRLNEDESLFYTDTEENITSILQYGVYITDDKSVKIKQIIYIEDLQNKKSGFYLKGDVTKPLNVVFERDDSGSYVGIEKLYIKTSDFQTIIKHLTKPLDVNNMCDRYSFDVTYSENDKISINVSNVFKSITTSDFDSDIYQHFLNTYSCFETNKSEGNYTESDLQEKKSLKQKNEEFQINDKNKKIRKTLSEISKGKNVNSKIELLLPQFHEKNFDNIYTSVISGTFDESTVSKFNDGIFDNKIHPDFKNDDLNEFIRKLTKIENIDELDISEKELKTYIALTQRFLTEKMIGILSYNLDTQKKNQTFVEYFSDYDIVDDENFTPEQLRGLTFEELK